MKTIIYPNLENPQKYKPPAFFLSLCATFSDVHFSCFLTRDKAGTDIFGMETDKCLQGR